MKTFIQKKLHQKEQGFTLVELAIVLVIIGLIVSSVLVGQDLIRSAELRATTKQYQEFQVAVNTFINKFGQIPGDANGATFGLDSTSTGGAGLGDQNGVITSVGSPTAVTTHNGEIANFWRHLTAGITGYIPGTYDGHEGAAAINRNDVVGENLPLMKLGTRGWGVYGESGVNYFVTGVSGDDGVIATDAYTIAEVFVPVDAFNIDDKIDDGDAESGNVLSLDGATGDPTDTPAGADCQASGTYDFAETAAVCSLQFEMVTF